MKAFAVGWAILLLAILMNLAASNLGIITWYEYLQRIPSDGLISASMNLKVIDCVFLFLIYPFSLGFLAIFVTNRM